MSTVDVVKPGLVHDREGGVWSYVSPSRLNLWLRCPLSFRLKYLDGITVPTSPALFVGKSVHAALEKLYRHRQLGVTLELPDITRRMDEMWDAAVAEDDVAFQSSQQELQLKQQAVDLVKAYMLQLSNDEPMPLAVEATMQTPLVDPANGEDLGVPLLGVVDLITKDADGSLITDFKTSSRSSPPFEISHEIQLSCYAYLYRQLSGQQEAGLEIRQLIKTKKPKIETHRYAARSERHFRRLFAVVREYLDALDAGRFNYRPGWACSMCDHRETHCRGWL